MFNDYFIGANLVDGIVIGARVLNGGHVRLAIEFKNCVKEMTSTFSEIR